MTDWSRLSDASLVAHARKGNRAAYGSLVHRYQNLVCAIAYSRLGNVESAHDIAQEAFLVSLENLDSLRSGAKFAAWLRRITCSLCNRWWRSEKYREALNAELCRQSAQAKADTPLDVLVAREGAAMLRHAMERLPESLRAPLVLSYFEGQSNAEMAMELGISRAAVVKRVERAKRRIREYVGEQVEAGLRKVQPDQEFTKRALAAIPAGSICGKFGVDVLKPGVAGAIRHLLARLTGNGPIVITQGGVEVTAGKLIIAIGAAVAVAAGGTVYLLARSGGANAQPPAVQVVTSEAAAVEAAPQEAPAPVAATVAEVPAAAPVAVAAPAAPASAPAQTQQGALFVPMAIGGSANAGVATALAPAAAADARPAAPGDAATRMREARENAQAKAGQDSK